MKRVVNRSDFINQFSVINKNKYTPEQTKSLYLGLLFELILSKEIFKKNIELEDFILKVYRLKYKNYLFRSRPYLASRLLKDISTNFDFLKISTSIKSIINYLKEEMNESDIKDINKGNRKNITDIERETIGWFNSVSKGSK